LGSELDFTLNEMSGTGTKRKGLKKFIHNNFATLFE